MSKKVEFSISNSRVIYESQKALEYIGKKVVTENEYNRIKATQEEADDVLQGFYDAALLQVIAELKDFSPEEYWKEDTSSLKRFLPAVDENSSGTRYVETKIHTLTLYMPEAWGGEREVQSVESALEKYVQAVVVQEWLSKFIGSETAEKYAADVSLWMATILGLLYNKKRPFRSKPTRKYIQITLHSSELLYDIYDSTTQTAEARDNGSNTRLVSLLKAGEEENNVLLRFIQSGLTNVRNALSDYYIGSSVDDTSNTLLGDKTDIVVNFSVPSNFNDRAKHNIADALHSYLLNMALVGWFKMKLPEEATVYPEQASAALQVMRDALYKRTMPTRG